MQESERLFAELEPLLAGAGLSLVELSSKRRGQGASVRLTIHSPSGTGTKECSVAHRLAYPRLQVLLGSEDVSLEVASPGIDRVLRSPREWAIFAGKAVRVQLAAPGGPADPEWIRGRIARLEGSRAILACAEGERAIELGAVAKARLDSSQEGD